MRWDRIRISALLRMLHENNVLASALARVSYWWMQLFRGSQHFAHQTPSFSNSSTDTS